ncbi:SurA N-terminal domain-containing protein [Psychroserpens luteolus]|uniref:SurA N-terminal domain-containing protein n=1 Tax=Psychroserpens luteolus TaxID=2855840 RepID=UPI001E55C076|nr:SurA N-terminal domain-containing protein [Psychroserpens luteolus]MCD2257697.1 SurA N-terminal domain-containing protein [Psychroserpens luteolus]
MAVLNKIRQRSLFLILIIALALFSFVLTDLFKNSDALFGGSQDVVATVNGQNINRVDFMNRVENMRRQLGPTATNTQAMNRVYDQQVRRAVMTTQFEELGLTVEEDQMRDLLEQNFSAYPEFQNEAGLFDESKLTTFIANLKEANPEKMLLGNFQLNYDEWVSNENSIATIAKERSYYNMVKAGVSATLNEAEVDHMLENSTRDLKYVQIPYSTINDSLIDVTKADIKAYINENKKQFEVEASRDIVFVEFKEEPSLKDEEALKSDFDRLINGKLEFDNTTNDTIRVQPFAQVKEEDLAGYVNLTGESAQSYNDSFIKKSLLPTVAADTIFNLNVGGVYGPYKDNGMMKLTRLVAETTVPDSAKVRHILIPFIGANRAGIDAQSEEDAKKTADSVLAIVKADNSKFPELVTALSSDQGSVANGGVYDFHPSTQMVKPFSDFEFQNNVGDIDVVKTQFGFHIIEILDQKGSSKAVKVATIARPIEPSEETIDDVFTNASKFELAIQDGDFQTMAEERKLVVKPVNNIKILDENIPGLQAQRPIVRWAFESETKVGDYKRFTIPGGGYAVVQLTKKSKAGLMDPENASASALSEIRKEKKAQMIREKITGTTVDDVAKNQNRPANTAAAVNMKNPTISGAGLEPEVVGVAFGLNEGDTSGLINGNRGVYMVTVTKANEATKLDNYQAIANRLSAARLNAAQTKVYNALKETADIEDNRSRFY